MLCILLLASCGDIEKFPGADDFWTGDKTEKPEQPGEPEQPGQPGEPEQPGEPDEPDQPEEPGQPEVPGTIKPFTAASTGDAGAVYVWDESIIPEITIHMTESEWNKLLKRYDEFSHNVDYFHADFTYRKGGETTVIKDGGIRLRGNTSRRRPEGNGGELHNSKSPDWHHCHFGINFRKFHKDKEHTIQGIGK